MLANDISYIVYDGECPFCSRYVKMLRLRDTIGPVELVNARSTHPVVEFLRARQVDLDNGMAFVYNGAVAVGDECIYKIALLSTASDRFNRLNRWIFRSETRSRLVYPVLRCGRNTTLRLLGRRKIGRSAVT